ncbi:predicted protein [Histoplasma capsulatum H143]|uniref:Uncharacterized protein n=1 Tax=Ajellomyces capsulatus (strain H143) TaxID=544712 RepID=C6H6P4_AJECH|nr:predicted protein [Histoplasma capsulatum H143]
MLTAGTFAPLEEKQSCQILLQDGAEMAHPMTQELSLIVYRVSLRSCSSSLRLFTLVEELHRNMQIQYESYPQSPLASSTLLDVLELVIGQHSEAHRSTAWHGKLDFWGTVLQNLEIEASVVRISIVIVTSLFPAADTSLTSVLACIARCAASENGELNPPSFAIFWNFHILKEKKRDPPPGELKKLARHHRSAPHAGLLRGHRPKPGPALSSKLTAELGERSGENGRAHAGDKKENGKGRGEGK